MTIFLLLSCASKKTDTKKSKIRSFSALVELDINEISNKTFETRGEKFKGNIDQKIDEIDDLDQIFSESIGEMNEVDLQDLSHVSEPIVQALVFCYQGRPKNGIKILNSIYSQYSSEPRYYNSLGVCYLKQNNLRKAKYFFDFSISINKYSPALNNLGVMYYKSGDFQKAFLLFTESIRVSRHQTSRFNLGLLFYTKGLYKKTIDTLNPISNSNQNVDNLNMLLASSHLMLGDLSMFEKFFERVKVKETFFSKISLALYYSQKKMKSEATKILSVIKTINSEQEKILNSYRKGIERTSK